MRKFYNFFTILFLAILLTPSLSMGQTIHEVFVANVGSGGFSPDQLNIVEGDIVRWTNTEGFHSVDGNSSEFPDNPEAFGNDAGSAGWVYEHTFTLVGDYNYWCGIHTAGMLGSITVSAATSVDEIDEIELISLYPNPAVNELKWNINEGMSIQNAVLTLYNISGKKVAENRLSNQTSMDVSQFQSGMYFFQIMEGDAILQTGKILVTN